MIDFLFAGHAPWFTVPAAVGTIFFALRLFFMLIGSDAQGLDLDVDAGAGGGGDAHADSDHTFKVLSVQSVAAFMMGFGWAGLASFRGSNWGIAESIVVGLLGGAVMVWFLGWLLKLVYDLQSSGNISIQSLVGRNADVYITVPERGAAGERAGRIRVVIDNRQRFYSAISTGPEIGRNARVQVVEVSGGSTLLVRPLDPAPTESPSSPQA